MNCGNLAVNLKSISGSKIVTPKDGYIYWHIREDKFTKDIDKYKVILAIENGFKELEKIFHPIQFKSTSNKEEAPILIGFYNDGDSGLPMKFDKYVLAYAYANYDGFANASDLFFNDAYKWAEMDKENTEVNLKKVFVHECLHALGFDHSPDKEDILYWQYQKGNEIKFSVDTINSVRERYKDEINKLQKIEPKTGNEVARFCREVINFTGNINLIPEAIFKRACIWFGLNTEGLSGLKLKSFFINYIKNA